MTNNEAKNLIKEFLDILKTEEESDSGRVFHPVYISSCRCLITKKINKILSELESWCQEGDNNA